MTDREKWEQAEMDLRETMKDLEACQKERDHLRRALEWLAREFAAHDKLACPERCGGVCVFWMSEEDEEAGTPCEERVTDDMPRGCWITAALAATEEAKPDADEC
jgi:hypothetical protein